MAVPEFNENYFPVRVRERKHNGQATLGTMRYSDGSQSNISFFSPLYEECRDRRHAGPPFNNGGPFRILRTKYTYIPTGPVVLNGALGRRYTGRLIPKKHKNVISYTQLPIFTPKTDVELDISGTEGWRKFKPGKPESGAGQFFVELRRLPSIDLFRAAVGEIFAKRQRLEGILNLGKRYLDYEFGWRLFIRDLQAMYDLTFSINAALHQLRRDNGRRVRRSGTVLRSSDVIHDITTQVAYNMYPSLFAEMYSQTYAPMRSKYTTNRHIWFSAGFRYHIPDPGSLRWTKRASRVLWGYNPSPELLWEIMPWSWLIDYFGNIGDVLSNLSENAAENLTADYAYLMDQSIDFAEIWETGHFSYANPFTATSKLEIEYVRKHRREASPYNFGVTPADLSTRQELILAALGISRGW